MACILYQSKAVVKQRQKDLYIAFPIDNYSQYFLMVDLLIFLIGR